MVFIISYNQAAVFSEVTLGSILGRLLFIFYINDLPSIVSSSMKIFANDVMYHPILSPNDYRMFQHNLDLISSLCSEWQMKLNVSKCEILCISRNVSLPSRITTLITVTLSGSLLSNI